MARPFCDGMTRRDTLRLGTAGLFGSPLALPRLLEQQARAATSEPTRKVKATAVIYVFLRSTQQLNVVHGRYWAVFPVSLFMGIGDATIMLLIVHADTIWIGATWMLLECLAAEADRSYADASRAK